MRLVALGPVAFIASAVIGASPVAADNASTRSVAMSQGWEFGERGGAELFHNVCAGCHQADAKGASGAGAYPPLGGDEKLATADFMVSVLLCGLKGMPPVGGMMSDAQVADVVNYVRTHFGNAYPDAISAADVAATRRPATPN
jgi:mono/diheme cytochrome c family protein